MQLICELPPGAVHLAPALYGGAIADRVGPALHVGVSFDLQELARAIEPALREAAIPWPHCDIGDGIIGSRQVLGLRQSPIENIELAFHLHRNAIESVFD